MCQEVQIIATQGDAPHAVGNPGDAPPGGFRFAPSSDCCRANTWYCSSVVSLTVAMTQLLPGATYKVA